jgi:hypothetical protein
MVGTAPLGAAVGCFSGPVRTVFVDCDADQVRISAALCDPAIHVIGFGMIARTIDTRSRSA